jgi:hypothetical protein
MKKYEFTTVIIKNENLDSGYIEFPYDTEKEFGKKGQVKVKVWFDGFLYRGSLVKMGHPCHIIGLNKEVRKSIHKNPGDSVHVIIEHDTEERTVTIPAELQDLLNKHKVAKIKFDNFSYSHKKEWVMWLNDAKKEKTRLKRLQKIIDKLME